MDFNNLSRTWIVAEIGVNHEGDEAVAADLIRQAAEAGADAVKFQTYTVGNYVSTVQPERRERSAGFELSHDAFRRLRRVADEAGVTFFSTPLHADDVDFLDEIAPIFKVSSGDLTYLELIRHVATKGKPTIISTGLGTLDEIRAAVDTFLAVRPDAGRNGELMLMHCVAAYPTPAEDANLRNMDWLKQHFDLPVGYSDHTLGSKACELAVAAGAAAIEKHFTYRIEDQAFHDHALSADPAMMKEIVAAVRTAETYLGRVERQRSEAEIKLIQHLRRSLAAARDIPAGTPVEREWLTYLRPAWGLLPGDADALVGRRLKQDVKAGGLIHGEDIADD